MQTQKFTLTKKSYKKHGGEALAEKLGQYATYEEAKANAYAALSRDNSRRVLFVQLWKEGDTGEPAAEYPIRKRAKGKPIPKGYEQSNYEIYYETAFLRLKNELSRAEPSEEETKKIEREATKEAKRLVSEERKAEAAERERERREAAKPAASTAIKAWNTYKEAKRAKEPDKAGKWKAYAIRKAKQAIEQGNADGLPAKLLKAAGLKPDKAPTEERQSHFYRVTEYKNGLAVGHIDKRTAKQAENAKACREANGKEAKIARYETEAENLAAIERNALSKTEMANAASIRGHNRKAETLANEAAGLWADYEKAGGKHRPANQ